MTSEFKSKLRRAILEFELQDLQPTPNNALQRTALKFTLFAFAKTAPFSSAAELLR